MSKRPNKKLTFQTPSHWRWIARDEDGCVCLYNSKPTHKDGEWQTPDGCLVVLPEPVIHMPGVSWVLSCVRLSGRIRKEVRTVVFEITRRWRWIARERDGRVWAYTCKPSLTSDDWAWTGGACKLFPRELSYKAGVPWNQTLQKLM